MDGASVAGSERYGMGRTWALGSGLVKRALRFSMSGSIGGTRLGGGGLGYLVGPVVGAPLLPGSPAAAAAGGKPGEQAGWQRAAFRRATMRQVTRMRLSLLGISRDKEACIYYLRQAIKTA
jgi:hypothetical protein